MDRSVQPDQRVRELSNLVLKFRDDLRVSRQQLGGQSCYVIEDPINGHFFRVGEPEYDFISSLDGRRSVQDAIALCAERGTDAITESEAATICRWLVESQLAHTPEAASPDRLWEAARTRATRRRWYALNPLFIRIPLLNPDRLLSAAQPWVGWLASWPFFLLWLPVVLVGLFAVLLHWGEFAAGAQGILAAHNWLPLVAGWAALKLAHETFHGLACKRFGGHVPEYGITLIIFAPVPYADVSTAWRFPSRWQRIFVSAAGMYVELFLAAIAAIVWARSEPGMLAQAAYNLIVTATIGAVVFNGNPLMRFDGYYILADLVDIPNLYSHGQRFLADMARWLFFGTRPQPVPLSAGREWVVRVYAVLALAWRVLVCTSLLVAAYALFHGAGIVLAAAGVVAWYIVPLVQLIRYLARKDHPEPLNFRRAWGVAAGLVIAAYLVFGWVPWPGRASAPGVLDYWPLEIVRCESPGFVRGIHVRSAQRVTADQVLAQLENPELEHEITDLAVLIEQSRLRERGFRSAGEFSAAQVEARFRQTLQSQKAEKEKLLAGLTIRAPIAGVVLGRHLDSFQGAFVQRGTEILAVAGGPPREITLAIDESQARLFAERVGSSVTVYVASAEPIRLQGRLVSVTPYASKRLPHEALGAAAGGPLPVRPHTVSHEGDETALRWELLNPYVEATVRLSSPLPRGIRGGGRVRVSFPVFDETIGEHLLRGLVKWFREKLDQAFAKGAERPL